MYKVKLSKAAKSDLKNAAFYIAYELKNETAAKRLLDQANKQLSALSETPECCPLVRDSFLAANAVRMMTIRKYLAFYIIQEESHSVFVLRIIHSRRDWTSILTDEIIDNS